MQFLAKIWKIIAIFGVGAPPWGKSWIRHWQRHTLLENETRWSVQLLLINEKVDFTGYEEFLYYNHVCLKIMRLTLPIFENVHMVLVKCLFRKSWIQMLSFTREISLPKNRRLSKLTLTSLLPYFASMPLNKQIVCMNGNEVSCKNWGLQSKCKMQFGRFFTLLLWYMSFSYV